MAPLLWTVGGSIAVSIVLNIVVGSPGGERTDQRDREIGRFGEHIGQSLVVVGSVTALLLALVRADYFWIANAIYLGFVLSAGSFAVQLAKRAGAHVTGVCSTTKVDLVRDLGADRVIDYTREPLSGTYDLIVDIAGNRPLRDLRTLLAPRGTLMLTGGENGGRLTGGMDRQLRAAALSPFTRQRLRSVLAIATRADLEALAPLTPAIDRTFPLAEAPAAIRYLAAGRARGKVVLTI